MPKQKSIKKPSPQIQIDTTGHKSFHLEFLHKTQEMAWQLYQKHDILFMSGVAGTGKTFLATAFAIHDILNKSKKKMVVTRPIVEAGESLGYLPGSAEEKTLPYMIPIHESIRKICGASIKDRETIYGSLEVCPLAFMRGRSFENSIFILDEAQNCTKGQIVLALSRLGIGSKMIITGDPWQSDLGIPVALQEVTEKLSSLNGVGLIEFKESSIVRHHLVGKILSRLK